MDETPGTNRWLVAAALLVVLSVAAGLRLYRLPDLPVGLHYDEAANGILAGEIARAERTPIFIAAYTGKEVLFFYWTALWMTLLGATSLALRLGGASVGIATVLATMWATHELLHHEPDGLWIALGGASFLAVSFWHLVLSRYGFRAVTQPLFQALTVGALWRGLRVERRGWVLLAGLFCGALGYTYLAARAFPVPLAAALLIFVIGERDRRRDRLIQLTWFVVAAALVLAPLAYYWLTHPGSFLVRTRQVAADSWSQVWEGLVACLGMFFLRGDPYIRFNLPHRPLFLPVAAVLLVVGLALGLWRLMHLLVSGGVPAEGEPQRRDASSSLSLAAYGFLLATVPVMILPSALATGEITPSNLRTVGLLPFVYVFPALGLFGLKSALARVMDGLGLAAGLGDGGRGTNLVLVAMVLGIGAPTTAVAYFRDWAPSATLYEAADGDMVSVSEYLNQTDVSSSRVYVASLHYRHPTAAFLAADYDDIRWLVQGRTLVFPSDADGLLIYPRSAGHQLDWVDTLLDGDHLIAAPLGPDGAPAFHAYRIGPGAHPPPGQAHRASFGGAAQLLGFALTAPPRSGDLLQIAVWWEVVGGTEWGDYRPVIRLADGAGSIRGEAHPFHYPSEQWAPGEVVVDHLSVPVAPGAPPGDYALRLGFYSPGGDARLALLDDAGAYAGTYVELPVRVGRAETPPPVEELPIRETLDLDVGGVTLLGFSLDRAAARPGERVHLTLFWRALEPDLPSHPLTLQLGDTQLYHGHPVQGTYPFGQWAVGEVVADRYSLRIPPLSPPGEHALLLRADETLVELGHVTVAEMDRVFQVPPVSYPVAVALGDHVELIGYDLSRESLAPGETLTLTLHWRVLAEMSIDYTVFTHLLGPDGSMAAQEDRQPVGGRYPTSLWLAEEVVTDVYELTVRADAAPGDHRLQVGMYVPEDGRRLPVEGQPGNVIPLHVIAVTE